MFTTIRPGAWATCRTSNDQQAAPQSIDDSLDAVARIQLAEDLAQVIAHRLRADAQPARDLLVGQTRGHVREDFELPWREPTLWCRPGDHGRGQQRVRRDVFVLCHRLEGGRRYLGKSNRQRVDPYLDSTGLCGRLRSIAREIPSLVCDRNHRR